MDQEASYLRLQRALARDHIELLESDSPNRSSQFLAVIEPLNGTRTGVLELLEKVLQPSQVEALRTEGPSLQLSGQQYKWWTLVTPLQLQGLLEGISENFEAL